MSSQSSRNEASAGAHDIHSLFHPQSIAFLGASNKPNTPASRGLRNCLRLGFKGGLYPINPKYDTLFGTRCYAGLAELPEVPELVMIGLSADKTLDAIRECEQLGVRMAVICSSGWEEQGAEGQERARQLAGILENSRIRVLGPNCLGAGNPSQGMSLGYNSSFESLRHQRQGMVGLITQSGAMMGGLLLNAEDVGADVALYAHIGNGMDITMEDIAEAMLDDPQVKSIAMMIEGLHRPMKFIEVARRARQLGKPIVAFKAGKSDTGRDAVMSHTGALAGSDEVFSAVCEETGIVRVDEPEDLMTTATALAKWSGKFSDDHKGIAVFTLSGGAASIVADECEAKGVPLATLSKATHDKLEPLLPSFVKVGNPFDIGGAVFTDPELPRDAMSIVLEDENVSAVLWVGVGAPRDDRSNLWLNQALDAFDASDKAGVIVSVSGHPQEAGFDRAHQQGIPVARSVRAAVDLVAHARAWSLAAPAAEHEPIVKNMPELPKGRRVLDEHAGKQILSELGVKVPRSAVAKTRDDVANVAAQLGFPLVLKGIVTDAMHKSELGLVALNITSADEAQEAATRMMDKNPSAAFEGFLVEEMASGGIEVVVGVKRDESFGPVMMFGLGGIFVELFKDVAFATCPVSPQRAHEMIHRTKAGEWLKGFRGQPAGDQEALIDAMVRLSELAAAYRDELVELDVNPIMVRPAGEGVIALDALFVCES